jgi:hypothetical protein
MTTVAHKRDDYDTRTGRTSRVAKIAVAEIAKPHFNEEAETGFLVREWTADEARAWEDADIALALKFTRAVEVSELLEIIPVGAIKAALNRGWLVKDPAAPWLLVTVRGQIALNLPKKDRMGRALRLFDNTKMDLPKADQWSVLKPLLPEVNFEAGGKRLHLEG